MKTTKSRDLFVIFINHSSLSVYLCVWRPVKASIFSVQMQQFELHAPLSYGDRLLIIIFQRSAGTKGYMAAKI